MSRRRTTFLIAAGLSVSLHAAVFSVFPRYEVGGVPVAWPDDARKPVEQMTIVLEPEPEIEEPEEKAPPEFEMGADKATGYATHEIPDKSDATAPEADQDQALLSLDPSGAGVQGKDASVTEAAGEGSTIGQPGGTPPPAVAIVVPEPAAEPSAPDEIEPGPTPRAAPTAPPVPPPPVAAVERVELPKDSGDDDATASPLEAPPAPESKSPPAAVELEAVTVVEASEPAPQPSPTPKNGGTRVGGSQTAAADPARMSDSESDPFSRLGTAIVRDGRLEIRFGRKVKTRRPKLLLAAQVELLTLRRAQVVLKIELDATGKVTSVEVVKSSGSNEIDQPTRVAVYDWWFEPKKDANGKAVPDEIQFTIGWR
jgi:TonB family protein